MEGIDNNNNNNNRLPWDEDAFFDDVQDAEDDLGRVEEVLKKWESHEAEQLAVRQLKIRVEGLRQRANGGGIAVTPVMDMWRGAGGDDKNTFCVVLRARTALPAGVQDRALLCEAFTRYLQWRIARKTPTRNVVPLQLLEEVAVVGGERFFAASLFPVIPDAGLMGERRNLGLQTTMCYDGTSSGIDYVGPWSLDPLGSLFTAHVVFPGAGDSKTLAEDALRHLGKQKALRIVAVHVMEEPLRREDVANDPALSELLDVVEFGGFALTLEVHKLMSFVSYFTGPGVPGANWTPFPSWSAFPHADLERQGALLLEIVKAVVESSNAKRFLHRGFLLSGPGGVGKTRVVADVIRFLRLYNIFGLADDGNFKIGSGDALKGGLQGDQEGKTIALFMRPFAAPWLPSLLSLDEVDFTIVPRDSIQKDSVGGIWLTRLGDDQRPRMMVPFFMTNDPDNVLTQLRSRLDAKYVGLPDWEGNASAIGKLALSWPDAMFKDPSCRHLWMHEVTLVAPNRRVNFYRARLMGMTPRAIASLESLEGIYARQLESAPWPQFGKEGAPCCFSDLIDDDGISRAAAGDCGLLLDFLLKAGERARLSGRVLVDLTRFHSSRMVIVEVELTHGLISWHVSGGTDTHQHSTARQSRSAAVGEHGNYFTRCFILRQQTSLKGLWAVLANFAVNIEASHCSYASETFTNEFVSGNKSGADERNRNVLSSMMKLYHTRCDRSVLVVPMSFARIQRPEEGGGRSLSSGSASIHAPESWDKLIGSWQPIIHNFAQQGKKKQLMVLLAHEEHEIDALLATTSAGWLVSDYRRNILSLQNEKQECSRCEIVFSEGERGGCLHEDKVRKYERVGDWKVCSPLPVSHETMCGLEGDVQDHAKWICCSQAFSHVREGCPGRNHVRYSDRETNDLDGTHHQPNQPAHWWCNLCCNFKTTWDGKNHTCDE